MTERDRIAKILESEEMTAKQFAEEVGIQAGTLSNILSERNRPSLDVMQRILSRFKTINPEWLILANGPMYRQTTDSQTSLFDDIKPEIDSKSATSTLQSLANIANKYGNMQVDKPITSNNEPQTAQQVVVEKIVQKKIKKILVFFDDDSFQEIVAE